MCRPNWLVFSSKSLDKGPILVKKSLKDGPISPQLHNCKINPFLGRKTLKVSRFAKISKEPSKKQFFEGEKFFKKWIGLSELGRKPRQK